MLDRAKISGLEKVTQQILREVKSIKANLQAVVIPTQSPSMLDVIVGALRENVSKDQIKNMLAWISKSYTLHHSETLEKALMGDLKQKLTPGNPPSTKAGKALPDVIEKKSRSQQRNSKLANNLSKHKSKGAERDGNESQVSIPPQSVGTFTQTDLFLNEVQELAEKKIDTTMSVQAMHT